MRGDNIGCLIVSLACALALGANCVAEEVASIDLTKVEARTELRRPTPAQETDRVRGHAIHQSNLCESSSDNSVLVRVALIGLDATRYRVGDRPRFEVTVENLDSMSLRIPFSPHLADLQPEDPSQEFAYAELHVALWIAAGEESSSNTGGDVTMYGDEQHSATMLTLNPGDSVRIVGRGQFALPADGIHDVINNFTHPIDHVYARASLFRVQTLVTATARASVSTEVCLRHTQEHGIHGSRPLASPPDYAHIPGDWGFERKRPIASFTPHPGATII